MTVYNGQLDESTGAFGLTGATDNVRGLVVVAVSSENIFALAATGAGGLGAGVAGAVTVQVVNSDTRAYIDANSKINTNTTGVNANQDVHVSAVNDVKTLVIVGSGGGGIAGVAGSIDVGVVRNDVTAFIAGSDVNAKRDIAVNALANRDVQSYAVSVGGGVVGVAGAISVYVLGGNLESSYTVNTNDSGGTASDNALLSDDGTGTGIGSTDGDLTITGLTDILGDFIGS